MVKVWCVIKSDGEAIDVGNTERGAKRIATRGGYPAVGYRDVNHYYITVTHRKVGGRWVSED